MDTRTVVSPNVGKINWARQFSTVGVQYNYRVLVPVLVPVPSVASGRKDEGSIFLEQEHVNFLKPARRINQSFLTVISKHYNKVPSGHLTKAFAGTFFGTAAPFFIINWICPWLTKFSCTRTGRRTSMTISWFDPSSPFEDSFIASLRGLFDSQPSRTHLLILFHLRVLAGSLPLKNEDGSRTQSSKGPRRVLHSIYYWLYAICHHWKTKTGQKRKARKVHIVYRCCRSSGHLTLHTSQNVCWNVCTFWNMCAQLKYMWICADMCAHVRTYFNGAHSFQFGSCKLKSPAQFEICVERGHVHTFNWRLMCLDQSRVQRNDLVQIDKIWSAILSTFSSFFQNWRWKYLLRISAHFYMFF
jgi:hypothetical protein